MFTPSDQVEEIPMERFWIGLDIGGSKTLLIIISEDHKLISKEKFPSSNKLSFVREIIHQSLHRAKIREDQVVAMGVGVAGIVDPIAGMIIDAPALKWKNLDVMTPWTLYFNFPIYINNDVNCALLGEKLMGEGKNYQNIFYISIGTGLGSALILNDKLIYGANQMAGEVAYTLDKDDVHQGKINVLGKFGIQEQKISGTALAQYFPSAKEFFNLYEAGNLKAMEFMEEFVIDISILIANVTSLINPEKVFLGGGVAEPLSTVLKKIKLKVAEMTPIPVKIELSSLATDGAAMGAAAYAMIKTKPNSF
jgi:glucokinase